MERRDAYEISVPPEKLFSYYANPRHLVMGNHKGPVIDQSDGEQRVGSWYVMAFDQLRARVEYTVFEPPREIAARVTWSGRGSGRATTENHWLITGLDGGNRSRVEIVGKGHGGLIPFAPLARLIAWLQEKRIKRAIERGD